MTVIYNSKAIIPGPLVDIRREIVRDEAGNTQRQFYSIQAKGSLVAYRGSPNSQGVFWTGSYSPGPPDELIPDASRLAAFRGKMKALNDLFCDQGQWFEIQPFDGSQSIKFRPRIKNINFAQGLWYNVLPYTIDMEADTIFFGGEESCGLLSGIVPQESWSIEAADQIGRTYRLTHSVSSQQKNLFDSAGTVPAGNTGWERARAIVLGYLGIQDSSRIYAPSVLNLSSNWTAFNYFRSQQIDQGGGRFAVNETWLVYDPTQGTGDTSIPPALDDFTVDTKLLEDGSTRVSIQGSVTGLEVRDIVSGAVQSTRWTNAGMYFSSIVQGSVFTRASNYSGVLLNPTQLMSSIGRNPITGVINYNAEYSNRRLPTIPGCIKEDINIQSDGGTDVFASIPVLGRPWGPVLQGMSTITQRVYSINISAQMQASTMLNPIQVRPNTDGIILALAPVALQVFREKDTIAFDDESGRYSRSVTFVYQ